MAKINNCRTTTKSKLGDTPRGIKSNVNVWTINREVAIPKGRSTRSKLTPINVEKYKW